MTETNKMKIPQGSESFFFEEAYIHRKLTEAIQNLFNSWGYLPVETPVFDLFDVYRTLIPESDADKIYRLIDREGDLLMLRSDITLFLARQMGLILSDKDLPARICYSDSILRHQNSDDISHNEFFQSGIELVGKAGFSGDMEVLLLLNKVIELLDIKAEIHLGSHALFNQVFRTFSEQQKAEILRMTELREFRALTEYCSSVSGAQKAEAEAELFSFIGSADELETLMNVKSDGREKITGLFGEDAAGELKYLIKIARNLEKAGFTGNFQIDLSEVGSQAYHTGIVFQVYMHGMDSAVISGGRYDGLLSKFGIDAPSVGFSLLQRKIEPGIGSKERFSKPADVTEINDKDIINAFNKAEKLRNEGKTVTL
ncbi:MAG: ATP phosphoribosyltransferase regulatory subunit [Spirochaetales bacterium]|uniref:Histidine--tRNA ligase n=1 Tax=Candidatus Thalassospirochaeta sargassi TaxID=3119039 RepID=A0AAJ1ILH1_9SPIO|nr:ATP phosphoribosyltransferase regulatory subunit [Spirochaetales bacterium]